MTLISHMSASHDEQLQKIGRIRVLSPFNEGGQYIFCDVYKFPEASIDQGLTSWNFGRNTISRMCEQMVMYKHIKLLHRKGLWWLTYEEKPIRTGTGHFDQPEGAIGWFECSGR